MVSYTDKIFSSLLFGERRKNLERGECLALKLHVVRNLEFQMEENSKSLLKIYEMLEYLIDNIFVEFGGRIFQQTIGIPMGTNCAPLLARFVFILV